MSSSKRLTLRLAPELHQLLLERANADRRSLNREIEFLLWEAFSSRRRRLRERPQCNSVGAISRQQAISTSCRFTGPQGCSAEFAICLRSVDPLLFRQWSPFSCHGNVVEELPIAVDAM